MGLEGEEPGRGGDTVGEESNRHDHEIPLGQRVGVQLRLEVRQRQAPHEDENRVDVAMWIDGVADEIRGGRGPVEGQLGIGRDGKGNISVLANE